MEMPSSRNFANLGRVIGVTIGCLLGMFPLIFKNKNDERKEKNLDNQNKKGQV